MFADITIREKNIRVFTTHLESFKLGRSSYFRTGDNGMLSKAKASVLSIRNAYRNRRIQMDLVKDKIDHSPYPVLILGNFGDVPNSETYTVLSENLSDAFLLHGSGFGATFPNITPNLRLDYILADKKILINNFEISESEYSDHYPIKADVSLRF
jgi:endonuclease/exonuclease/phosphatase family metal-dependent hydrolase